MEDLRALKLEKLHRLKMEEYRRKPLLWFEERFGGDARNFEWSKMLINGKPLYEHHLWDGDIDPLASAWQYIGSAYEEVQRTGSTMNKYVAIESATGVGKTFWLALLVYWFLDCFENSLVVTSAPTDAQLKVGLWSELSKMYPKFKKLRPHSKKWRTRLVAEHTYNPNAEVQGQQEEAENSTESWQAVMHIAGVGVDEESANKARGFHRQYMLIILEEATGIPLPILTAFKNTSTGNTNFIVAVGNPNNEHDTLHQFAEQADTYKIRVSALDHPNIIAQSELIAGAVVQSSIDSRILEYGEESPVANAMIRGISPAQSSDALVKAEWFDQCVHNEEIPTEWGAGAAGVDVANSVNGDKAAIAWGEGNELLDLEEFACPNASYLAYNMYYTDAELAIRGIDNYATNKLANLGIGAEYVGVDAVGVGVSTINAFTDLGMNVTGLQGGQWEEVIPKDKTTNKPMYKFANLRTQMYWEAREDLRLMQVKLSIGDKMAISKLKRELTVPRIVFKNGVIALESKESIKKRVGNSPNKADAFVYWNWIRKGYRKRGGSPLPVFGG